MSDYSNYNKLVEDGFLIIRIGSHRCRSKIEGALGYLPQTYFSYWQNGEFCAVTPDQYNLIKTIKGVTKARKVDRLYQHIKWD